MGDLRDEDWGNAPAIEQQEWPERPLLLAGLGLAAGLLAHLILGNGFLYSQPLSGAQAASLGFVLLTAALIGFTVERRYWWAAVAFGLGMGMVGGLVTYSNGSPGGWSASEGWRMVSLLLAVAIAAPLFQAMRDAGPWRVPYAAVHDHAWTNVVLWAACWVFVAIVFALAWLLAMLFGLIKIEFLRDLLDKNWFWRSLMGLAFGAGLGLLREHDRVVRLLQRVVATVLAVLAPVLAIGLILFLLSLPFTGLQALWDATSATTPILLTCAVGALILTNAVIGDVPEHERRFVLLRFGALGLALTVLPLALLASIATGLRIDQYGYTPERLWALVFVMLASAYGTAYLASVVLGRLHWEPRVRDANLKLAFGVLAIALVLATPLISFNAISTRDQVARLESGKVTPERFDWRALAFDFGAPGRAALQRLQASANATIKAKADAVLAAKSRWEVADGARQAQQRSEAAANMRVLPTGSEVPAQLRDMIAEAYNCIGDQKCTLLATSNGEALLFSDRCFEAPKPRPTQAPTATVQVPVPAPAYYGCDLVSRYVLKGGKWQTASDERQTLSPAQAQARAADYAAGRIEIRSVSRRQAYVGGVPVGAPFE
jgi:hypothetical protein